MSYKECSKDCQIGTDVFYYGATPQEWEQAERSVLMPWIVPIYANRNTPTSKWSHISETSRGKVPTVLNNNGEVIGLPDWTHREKNTDLSQWRSDPDYGFGVRCGYDGLFGLDCDCEDEKTAQLVKTMFKSTIGDSIFRTRGTSPRWACILKFDDDKPIKFEPIRIDGDGDNMVEIRGTGQQLACAGTHPKGSRYVWSGDLGEVLTVDREKFSRFWKALGMCFGKSDVCVDGTVTQRKNGETIECDDPLADWLCENWDVYGYQKDGGLCIRCPWANSHSGEHRADSETVYFPMGTRGYHNGGFKCMHAHCADRTFRDFVNWAKENGYVEAPLDYPDMSADVGDKPLIEQAVDAVFDNDYQFIKKEEICYPALLAKVRKRSEETGEVPFILKALDVSKDAVNVRHVKVKRGGQSVTQDVFGGFVTNNEVVGAWLSDPAFCGVELAWDATCGFIYRKNGDPDWKNYDMSKAFLDIQPYKYGFDRSMRPNDITTLACAVAKRHESDLLRKIMLDYIPKPGTYERGKVDRFMREILHAITPEGCEDWYDDFLVKLSRYMWAGYYARLTEPEGISLRTIPVFKSENHSGKDAFCAIMAFRDCMDLFPSCFKEKDNNRAWAQCGLSGSADFDADDRTFANNTAGKTVAVFSELAGLNRADANKNKKRITDIADTYNEKYIAGSLTQIRRWFPIMNTNEDRFLSRLMGDTRLFMVELERSENLGRGVKQLVIELDKFKEWLPDLLAEGREYALERSGDSSWTTQNPIIAGACLLNDDLMQYGESVTELARFEDADADLIEDVLRTMRVDPQRGVSFTELVRRIKETSPQMSNNKVAKTLKDLKWTRKQTKTKRLWMPPKDWDE